MIMESFNRKWAQRSLLIMHTSTDLPRPTSVIKVFKIHYLRQDR